MALWQSSYSPYLKELLHCLDNNSLLSLASTATNGRLLPENTKEAIEIILRYTENLGRFFSYRRITSQVLFDYLHKKKVPVRGGESKTELIDKVKKEWENSTKKNKRKAVVPHEAKVIQDAGSGLQASASPLRQLPAVLPRFNCSMSSSSGGVRTDINLNLSSPGVHVNLEVRHGGGGGGGGGSGSVRSDTFTREFCRWFYTMINGLQPQGAHLQGETFSPDVFVANCSLDMYLCGLQSQNMEKHASGQQDTYALMKGVFTELGLCFAPNIENGTQAEMSVHGMVRLFCCGMLHHGEAMVGIFEHEFGLVWCPEGKWKIMTTKMNLKHSQSTSTVPTLPRVPVFDIPC